MAKTTLKPTKVIHFAHKSELDDTLYQATLIVKRLSIADKQRIDVRACQLNGGFTMAEEGVGLNLSAYYTGTMIATVEAGIERPFPEWLDPENMYDIDLLMAVHKEVQDFQNSFRPKPKLDRLRETGSQAASGTANQPGHTEPVVFPEIQGSLEP